MVHMVFLGLEELKIPLTETGGQIPLTETGGQIPLTETIKEISRGA